MARPAGWTPSRTISSCCGAPVARAGVGAAVGCCLGAPRRRTRCSPAVTAAAALRTRGLPPCSATERAGGCRPCCANGYHPACRRPPPLLWQVRQGAARAAHFGCQRLRAARLLGIHPLAAALRRRTRHGQQQQHGRGARGARDGLGWRAPRLRGDAARPKRPCLLAARCPCGQPPTDPEAQPLARGCPLGPRREPSPRGCWSGAAAALWRLPKVADVAALDHPRWRRLCSPSSSASCLPL
eukprot:scaffold11580_cov30-Phaeocystis_antarctica.AAC.1